MSSPTVALRVQRAFWAEGRRFAPGEVHAFPVLVAADLIAGGRATYAADADAAAELVRDAVAADARRVVAGLRSPAAAPRGYF